MVSASTMPDRPPTIPPIQTRRPVMATMMRRVFVWFIDLPPDARIRATGWAGQPMRLMTTRVTSSLNLPLPRC